MSYIDLAGDMVTQKVNVANLRYLSWYMYLYIIFLYRIFFLNLYVWTSLDKCIASGYFKLVWFSPNVKCLDPPKTLADPDKIKEAIDLIHYAEKPLVIVGKGRFCWHFSLYMYIVHREILAPFYVCSIRPKYFTTVIGSENHKGKNVPVMQY